MTNPLLDAPKTPPMVSAGTETAPTAASPNSPASPHLLLIKVGRCGVLKDQKIGPLSSGFNLIVGPNEAGKTTIASFVGGVLFGWDEIRGFKRSSQRNQELPFGSLVFARNEGQDSRQLTELKRDDHDRLNTSLSSAGIDIDKVTYKTLFALTGDELRGFRSSSQIITKLLNVSAGTPTPPSQVLQQINERIAALTEGRVKTSLSTLNRERLRIRGELKKADERRNRALAVGREQETLRQEQSELASQIEAASARIKNLKDTRHTLDGMDQRLDELTALRAQTSLRYESHQQRVRELIEEVGKPLAELSAHDERMLRSRLATFEEEQLKLEASEDLARHHLADSQAAYEIALEAMGKSIGDPTSETAAAPLEPEEPKTAPPGIPRKLSLGISAFIFTVFTLIGVPLFLYGRQLASLSVSSVGLAFIAIAVVIAIFTVVFAFRPIREPVRDEASERNRRISDALWVMRKDQQRLASVVEQKQELSDRLRSELAPMGLGSALQSVRQIRQLLDDAKEIRGDIAQQRQGMQACASRLAETDRALGSLAAEKENLASSYPMLNPFDRDAITAELARQEQLLEALETAQTQGAKQLESLQERFGLAIDDRRFDSLKLELETTKTSINDANETLIRLLLAKRQLEVALATWGAQNQPEIYAQASAYLRLLTEGHWCSLELKADGRLSVKDKQNRECNPASLSLATTQQLYLALRLALLVAHNDIGQSLPVLADDIFANFDGDRLKAGLRALRELASTRQVIFFTCHEFLEPLVQEIFKDSETSMRIIHLKR